MRLPCAPEHAVIAVSHGCGNYGAEVVKLGNTLPCTVVRREDTILSKHAL